MPGRPARFIRGCSLARAVSKRRFQTSEETPPEKLTPEERRAQRARERAKQKAGHAPTSTSPWRKAFIIGIPVAIIAVIAIVLVVSNLPTPCIQFSPIANSTASAPNEPTFPTTVSGSFDGTWCISSTPVYSTSFYLRIDINNNSVAIPGLIGERANYTIDNARATCDLPIHSLTNPQISGVVQIDSPWAYQYNLSMFFNVWSQSDSNVYVSSSDPNQPIIYQTSNLLGFTSNASASIHLFVDNQPSSLGPNLDLTTHDYGSTTPTCMGQVYGTGHTILLTYGSSKLPSYRPVLQTPGLSTGLADPEALLQLYGGPAPQFALELPLTDTLSLVHMHSFDWLVLRAGP